MNPIEQLIGFLNILIACTALSMSEMRIDGDDYLIQHWTCQADHRGITVDAWRKWCITNGHKYMGRPFFLEFDNRQAYYLDRFGYVLSGDGALVSNAYQPICGS